MNACEEFRQVDGASLRHFGADELRVAAFAGGDERHFLRDDAFAGVAHLRHGLFAAINGTFEGFRDFRRRVCRRAIRR